MPKPNHLSRCISTLLVLGALGAGVNALAQAPNPTPGGSQFSIERQSLDAALSAFSRSTGLQVVADARLTNGRESSAVNGTMSTEAALKQLLNGSGLVAQIVDGTVYVRSETSGSASPAAAPAPIERTNSGNESATTLDAVVVVSGYRSALNSARNAKRNASDIRDSIFADDIADFADLNLAEAIQRVPGVYITRDGGEGRQVALRGLGPDYTRVQLNGLEALTTTASTDQRGAVNRGRAFDFNVFASELFNRVDVRKSTEASLDEGGIAGTVDLRTAKPFDYDGFKLAASGQAFYSDRAGEASPRMAFLMSNTWGDEFGALVSVAYTDRLVVEDGVQTIRWQSGGWNLANVASTVDPAIVARLNSSGADRLFYPRTPRYFNFIHDQQRLGVTGALQWRPSDALEFDYDVLFADYDAVRYENFLDAPSFTRTNATGLPETIVRSLQVAGNDIVRADLGNVDNRLDARRDDSETRFIQHSLVGRWTATDRLALRGLIGFSESEFQNDTLTLQAVSNNSNFGWDFTGNDRVPLWNWGVDLDSPDPWRLDLYRPRRNEVENGYRSAKLDVDYSLGSVLLRAGLAQTRYDFRQRDFGADVSTTGLIRGRTIDDLVIGLPYGFGGNFSLPTGAPSTWLVLDIDRADRALNLSQFNAARTAAIASEDRDVREETFGAYVQADFDWAIGSTLLRGNVGVRRASTDLTASGTLASLPVTLRRDYARNLPSLNLTWELNDDVQVRFAANRNFTRPTLGSLTPNGSVSLTTRTISYGNPDLEPFSADSYDLSFEWYYSDDGYMAVSPFYKAVDVFVVNQSTQQAYRDTGLPIALLGDQTQATPADVFTVRRPVNGGDANVRGLELLAQQAFTFLPGWLAQTGVAANYTFVDSEALFAFPDGSQRTFALPGVSRHSANLTAYYEDERFGLRISGNYRDRYLTTVPGANGNDSAGVNAATYMDFSAFVNLADDFKLTFEALNLSNEAEDQYVDTSDRVNSYAKSGRQYLVGLRYTFR
jgi:TonB-dependent receptor